MAPWLARRDETLVVNYHNITPPELMAPWDNHLALGQLRAQGDLRLLAPRAALAVADSAYNEAHLLDAGFATTSVIAPSAALDPVPEAVGVSATTAPERPGGHLRAPSGGRWLAVGRVSPNKALEATVAALAVARAHGDPGATSRSWASPPRPPMSPRSTATWPSSAWLGRCDSAGTPATRRGRGLPGRRRARGHLGARGVRGPRRRGHGGRTPGGRLRRGRHWRGARWRRRAGRRQGPVRAGGVDRLPAGRHPPLPGSLRGRPGAGAPARPDLCGRAVGRPAGAAGRRPDAWP